MGNLVIRNGLKILGTLGDGSGDEQLTIDSTSKEIAKVPSVDSTNFISSTLQDGRVLIGNASNIAQARQITGSISITNTGVASIANSVITNANISPAAGITYAKLSLTNSIVNNDISPTASIARTKIANGTANRVLINNGSGVFSENTAITANRALISDANGLPTHSTVTSTVLSFLDISSSLQASLDDRLFFDSSITPAEGDLIQYTGGAWNRFAVGTSGQLLSSDGTNPVWVTDPPAGLPVGGSAGQYLNKIDGTDYNAQWSTLVLSKITDVTALVADVNLLTGLAAAGLTTAELGYVNGVTSSIQTQIDLKLSKALTENYLFIGNASNVAIPFAPGSSGDVLSIVGGVPTWVAPGSGGTVTSIDVSGGTTGLTTTGGPINTSGTITLTGTLIAANGGTGFASYAVGDLLYADTTTTLTKLVVGTNGHVLTLTAGVPTWSAPSGGTTLTGSTDEIIKYASSTSGVGTRVFSTVNGDLTLGDVSLASSRLIRVLSSTANAGIEIRTQGTSYVTLGTESGINIGTSSYAGNTRNLTLLGSGADISLIINTKGTGIVYANSDAVSIGQGAGTTKTLMFSNASGTTNLQANPNASYTITLPNATGTVLLDTTAAFWSLASGGTLTGANTVTGTTTNIIKYVFNTLNATQTNGAGLWLANTTAATSIQQQWSPSLVLEGQGWKTNAVAASQSIKFRQYITIASGAAAPTGIWNLDYSIDGAAYVAGLTFSTATTTLTTPVLTVSSSASFNILSASSTNTATAAIATLGGAARTGTSGTQASLVLSAGFAPTSGTAIWNPIQLTSTINQTGGANGQVTMSQFTPVITAAVNVTGYDWNPTTPTNISGTHIAYRAVSGSFLSGSSLPTNVGGYNYVVSSNTVLTALTSRNSSSGTSGASRIVFENDAGRTGLITFGSSTHSIIPNSLQITTSANDVSLILATNNNTTRLTISGLGAVTHTAGPTTGGTWHTYTQIVNTSGNPQFMLFTGAAHTTMTAGASLNEFQYNLARSIQWSSNTTVANYRGVYLQAPTGLAFASATGTVTKAATLAISGPPVAGTNGVITGAWSLDVESGNTRFGGEIFLLSGAVANDDALTRVLVYDTGTGQVKYRTSASLGGGGFTNTAANTELAMSDGTNLDPSGLFIPSATNLQLGSSGLTGDRTISAINTAGDAELTISSQDNMHFTASQYDWANNSATAMLSLTTTQAIFGDSGFTVKSKDLGGGIGRALTVQAGNNLSGSFKGGDLTLQGGSGSSGIDGDLILETRSSTGTLKLNDGANEQMGIATLVGGTVTVNNTKITANTRIFYAVDVAGGTQGFLRISARTAGTSFTITSTSGTETSTVVWMLVEPN